MWQIVNNYFGEMIPKGIQQAVVYNKKKKLYELVVTKPELSNITLLRDKMYLQ